MITDNTQATSPVTKHDSVHQICGGWAAEFNVRDLDNESLDIEDYHKSAIDYARNARTANINHEQGVAPVGFLIDNLCIDSVDFAKHIVNQITGIPEDQIPVIKIGHFVSYQIDDRQLFEEIEREGAMFSIEGDCIRVLEDE